MCVGNVLRSRCYDTLEIGDNQKTTRPKENSGKPLNSERVGPNVVTNIRGGVRPAVDFQRMDKWTIISELIQYDIIEYNIRFNFYIRHI